jgi:hypothetical protein
MLGYCTSIKDGGFGRHVAVNNTELFRVWRPGHVVDRSLLVCVVLVWMQRTKPRRRTELHSRVEGAVCTQNVHVCLAVVALVRLINLSLGKDNQARA